MDVISRIFAIILFILLFPAILIIAFLNFIFNGSPIIFKQERYGYNLKSFWLYKFRTMVPNEGEKISSLEDSRITSFGRVLRKSKLDEIPQLFNIIKGDMRFIGPRPEVKEYFDKNDFYFLKSIKPGISCFASILFRDEAKILYHIGGENPYLNILNVKIELAIYYAEKKSFLLDLKLIFYTILSIFFSRFASSLLLKTLPLEKLPKSKEFFYRYII